MSGLCFYPTSLPQKAAPVKEYTPYPTQGIHSLTPITLPPKKNRPDVPIYSPTPFFANNSAKTGSHCFNDVAKLKIFLMFTNWKQ
jgi:hypothetical protein